MGKAAEWALKRLREVKAENRPPPMFKKLKEPPPDARPSPAIAPTKK